MNEKKSVDICGISLETIERLAKIVKDNELEEIKITDKGVTGIVIKGKKCPPPPPVPMPPQMMGGVSAPMPPMPKEKQPSPAKQAEAEMTGHSVRSPIVGTYYSSPAPGKPPFVSVGQTVHKGDVIMIIESMKLMNEVQSEYDGVVKKILVKDGEPVEYDQTIMVIG